MTPGALLPLRFVLTPVIAVIVLVTGAATAGFWVVFGLRAVSQLVTLLLTRRPATARILRVLTPFDLVLLGALVATSGGAQSPLRGLLLVLPLVIAVVGDRRAAVLTGLIIGAAYFVPAVPDAVQGEDGALTAVVLQLAGMVFATAIGMALAGQRMRVSVRSAALERDRRRLLTGVLAEEDTERRRVSQLLHAETLQALLAARQDLEDAEEIADGLPRARAGVTEAVAVLDGTIRDLDPAPSHDGGLEEALAAIAARRLRGAVTVTVAPGATGGRSLFLAEAARATCSALARAGAEGPIALAVASEAGRPVLTVRGTFDEAPLARWAAHADEVARGAGCRIDVAPGVVRAWVAADDPIAEDGPLPEDPELEASARRVRLVALALLVPFVATGDEVDPLFGLVAAGWVAAVAWTAAVTRRAPSEPRHLPVRATLTVLLYFLSVLTTGGADSALRFPLLLVPFLGVFVLGARANAAVSAGLVLAFVLAAVPEIARGTADAAGDTVMTAVALAWSGAVASVLAGRHQALTAHAAELARGRRRLLHAAARGAREERQRLAGRLRDEPLEALLAAGQDLDEAIAGDAAGRRHAETALAEALGRLRAVVDDLHPPALEHGGLPAALAALGRDAAMQGGFRIAVDVDPAAGGRRDELVVSIVRELVRNAAVHASATTVRIAVERLPEAIRVTVADDGVGLGADDGLDGGGIGLASCRERAAAAGGSLEVTAGAVAGTVVTVELPATPLGVAGAAA